jgi:penicillin-binding protein 2
MAQVVSLIANRGPAYVPRLVDHIEEEENTPLQTISSQIAPQHISSEKNWKLIINAMQQVVHSPLGTAYRMSKNLPYQMAGKTGTSQVFNLKQHEKYVATQIKAHLRDHSWFIAFAPVEKPQIAIAVLIENKEKIAGIDVARQVFDAFFKDHEARAPQESTHYSNTSDGIASESEENMTGGLEHAP